MDVYQKTIEQVLTDQQADPQNGLTAAQAAPRDASEDEGRRPEYRR